MDLINGFGLASLGFGSDPSIGLDRKGGRYNLVVSEHPGSDSDPPIGSNRNGGRYNLVVLEPRFRRFWKNALNVFVKGY